MLAELRTKRFGTLTYVLARSDAEDVSLFDRARGRNISVYASPDRLASRGRYYSEDETAAYDVDVRFDPEREWISGKGSVRLKTRRDGLATLSLKLAEPLAISSILVTGVWKGAGLARLGTEQCANQPSAIRATRHRGGA